MKTNNTKSVSFLFAVTVLAIFTFSGCYIDDYDCIRGRGQVYTEVRSTSEFNSVDLRIPARMILTQHTTRSVEVKTYDNLLPEIFTYVNGSTLIIDSDRCFRNSKDEIEVYISAPDFSRIRVSGSGSVESSNMLDVPDIDLNVSGSGSIDVGVNTVMVNSRISGSGSIWIEGDAFEHNVEISGSGSVNSFPFYTDRTNISISGSGNCEVRVYERLVVSISGSGTVRYKGYPAITSTISGSGRVINAN